MEIDFYITGVRYTDDESEIESVQVQLRLKPITGKSSVSASKRIVNRGFIYDLLRTGKVVFCTATYDQKEKAWDPGAEVIIYGDKYITTVGNEKEKDNLENLPSF